jgi:hypothetical protein
VGRKDAVGKPLLFGTTDNFLKKFGLTALTDLPDYEELLNRIDVLHNPEDEGNSLFNFRDTEDEITEDEAKLKGIKKDEVIENIENVLDTEKLKQELLNDKSGFKGLLEDEDDDFSNLINV